MIVVALAVAVAACSAPSRSTFPPLGSTPAPAGTATAATRDQVLSALAAAGIQAVDSTRPFRPPEGALLAAAPRTVLEVPISNEPHGAWIVIYGLGSPADAALAAEDHAAYVASGPGRIQFGIDTRFVIQVVGSTVVFFTWSPAHSSHTQTAPIAEALAALGREVPVGN